MIETLLCRETLPPIELDNLRESQIRNQVGNMGRNDDGRGHAARVQVILHNRAQRWAMQVIEVCVRNQHQINGRKIGNAQLRDCRKRLSTNNQRAKLGSMTTLLAADLNKEAGMSDEGDAEFSVSGEARLVSLTAAPRDRRMAHQARELAWLACEGPDCAVSA